MTSIIWRRIDRPGMERAELAASPDGYRLSGTSLFTLDEAPVEIRYSITLDGAWRTRVVGVHVRTDAENRSVALRSDGDGNWEAEGRPVPDLSGAVDIDLAWTPATNTIAIRRLGLGVDEHAETSVALVPFPEREVSARSQSYERVAERRYRYTSGDFSADLTVDEHGFVTTYPGIWTALIGR